MWNIRFRKFLKKDVLSVTLDDIRLFKEFLVKRGYSPKNIQYGLTIVKEYLTYLVSVEALDFPIALFKIQTERAVSHYALTEEEYTLMLAQLKGIDPLEIQRTLMLRLLWETGIRVGELLSIEIGKLIPHQTFINNEKNKRRRLIVWSNETEELLQKYLKMRKKVWTDSDSLFVSLTYRKKTNQFTSRQVERIVHDTAKNAGLVNKISPHSFRHGFVHRQLAQGKPITTVAQMLGHSTPFNILTYHQLSGLEVKEAWRTVA